MEKVLGEISEYSVFFQEIFDKAPCFQSPRHDGVNNRHHVFTITAAWGHSFVECILRDVAPELGHSLKRAAKGSRSPQFAPKLLIDS